MTNRSHACPVFYCLFFFFSVNRKNFMKQIAFIGFGHTLLSMKTSACDVLINSSSALFSRAASRFSSKEESK